MAETERATQNKQTDVDQKHRVKKKDSEQSFDQFHAWEPGIFSIAETPFVPRTDEHAELLAMSPSDEARANLVLQLQQTYGNRYVQCLIESMGVQAKLTVNAPNDIYEQEADRVAESVIRAANSQVQRQAEEEEELQLKPSQVQSQEVPEEEEEEEELQAQPTESQLAKVSDDLETRINSARGSGQALTESVRNSLEPQFGIDFSDVRLHTDTEADKLSKQLGAQAFTSGKDIFFREGTYQPDVEAGKKLLAHELTHVVQQSHDIQTQQEEKGQEQGKLIQTVSRFEVCFVDDGRRAKLQVGKEEEEAEIGKKEAEEGKQATNVKSYGYIEGLNWAWEASAEWATGKLVVPVKEAEDHALEEIKSAEESINKSKLDENKKKEAMVELGTIAKQIPECFTGRATGKNLEEMEYLLPYVDFFREVEEFYYKGEMNTGDFTSIEFLNDEVTFIPAGGGPPKPPAAPQEEKQEEAAGVEHYVIYFGYNKDTFLSSYEAELQKLALLLQDPNSEAHLIGHASAEGDPTYNLELSRRRVNSVVNFLEKQGVAPDKLHKEALGETVPAKKEEGPTPEKIEEKRALNRRVEIKIVRK